MREKPPLYSFAIVLALITIGLWTSSAYARTQKPELWQTPVASGQRGLTGQIALSENAAGDVSVDQLTPERTDGSISLLTRYEVKASHLKIFRKQLRRYVRHALRKEDNIMAEGYYEEESPSVMWVIERWSSNSALDKNRKRIKYKVGKLLSENKLIQPAKAFYVNDLEPLSKTEWRREASKKGKPITIMLFVDSKAGTEDDFKEIYHSAMPQFRNEAGVVTYQLSQFVGDNTQFVTYEKFRNEDAFQYHLKFPPIQPVLDYLTTSIKQQPFQNGLHRLVMFAPLKRK